MRIGTKVKILETGEIGRISSTDYGGKPKEVITTTGKVVNVLDKTIIVLTLLKEILELLKAPFKKLFGW